MPFCPFYFKVSLLKPNGRKKGTLITKGLLRNLGKVGLGGAGSRKTCAYYLRSAKSRETMISRNRR